MSRNAAPQLKHLLFDPQLYLAGLTVESSLKKCSTLATHAWFCVPEIEPFESGEIGQRAWAKHVEGVVEKHWPEAPPDGDRVHEAVHAAFLTQLGFGCTAIILPTPLLDTREDEGALLGTWLDAGLEVAEELEVGQPLYATVAIAESVLNDAVFASAGFLDAVVDQVSARPDLKGVYLVVAQAGEAEHPFGSSIMVWRAYAHLAKAFRSAGIDRVITNFADVFGLACLGLGATGVATGSSQSTRRLSLEGFRDDGGGLPIPHLYSHPTIGEFATERDLNEVVAKNLLGQVRDETLYSQEFIEALEEGETAGSVAEWAEGKNNVTTASLHFITRMILSSNDLVALGSIKKRHEAIREWLLLAGQRMSNITPLLVNTGAAVRSGPAKAWLKILEST